jgi:hypothetical protein
VVAKNIINGLENRDYSQLVSLVQDVNNKYKKISETLSADDLTNLLIYELMNKEISKDALDELDAFIKHIDSKDCSKYELTSFLVAANFVQQIKMSHDNAEFEQLHLVNINDLKELNKQLDTYKSCVPVDESQLNYEEINNKITAEISNNISKMNADQLQRYISNLSWIKKNFDKQLEQEPNNQTLKNKIDGLNEDITYLNNQKDELEKKVLKVFQDISSLIEQNKSKEAIQKIESIQKIEILEQVGGSYLFDKALNQSNIEIANALLKKGLELNGTNTMKPLGIDYSASQALELQGQVNRWMSNTAFNNYKDLLDTRRNKYCSDIQNETKNLRIIGVKMLMNLISDKETKNSLSHALSSYMKNPSSTSIETLQKQLATATQTLTTAGINNTDAFKKAKNVLNKATHLDETIKEFNRDRCLPAKSLDDFKKEANTVISEGKNDTRKDSSFLSQKIQACFDAILKAIDTHCDFMLSNKQKQKVTLTSIKEEISKLKEASEDPKQQPALTCR